jgi:hypothetical protein
MQAALIVALPLLWLLPSDCDGSGWALRCYPLDTPAHLVAGESIPDNRFVVILMNRGGEKREYTPLALLRAKGKLDIDIVGPDGKSFTPQHTDPRPRTVAGEYHLAPGAVSVEVFSFWRHFGYSRLVDQGIHRFTAQLTLPEGRIEAPPFTIEVIEPSHQSVLSTYTVPPDIRESQRRKADQDRVIIQQIRINDRVYLYHRQFNSESNGGKIFSSRRIAELPEKCEVNVTGTFGRLTPLEIVYKIPGAAQESRITVLSRNGKLWTPEDEADYQEAQSARPKEKEDK